MTSVDLVRSLFEAFQRGDIGSILARVAPDCRWVAPGAELPYGGEYRGPSGAAEFFARLGEAEQFTRFEPQEYYTNGDDVVALGMEECRSKATGKKAKTSWAMVFRVRDGLVTSWESFFDTAAYVRAHAN